MRTYQHYLDEFRQFLELEAANGDVAPLTLKNYACAVETIKQHEGARAGVAARQAAVQAVPDEITIS